MGKAKTVDIALPASYLFQIPRTFVPLDQPCLISRSCIRAPCGERTGSHASKAVPSTGSIKDCKTGFFHLDILHPQIEKPRTLIQDIGVVICLQIHFDTHLRFSATDSLMGQILVFLYLKTQALFRNI